ncbi:MipA/OmpV family protein [Rhodanobacter sp. 115]|uniref:MipA/OmpV family protein n=1 Tax=Rhodanobacter sp. FW021-MT20 TaxID=1162282 RepID=UPI0009DAC59E
MTACIRPRRSTRCGPKRRCRWHARRCDSPAATPAPSRLPFDFGPQCLRSGRTGGAVHNRAFSLISARYTRLPHAVTDSPMVDADHAVSYFASLSYVF